MGNKASSAPRATCEDVLSRSALLITVQNETAPQIAGTTPIHQEVEEVERAIASRKRIIIYGKNCHDDRIYLKCAQIAKLGGDPRVYIGGLFEWVLLQEYYGADKFATTEKVKDVYKFRPL